jgi:pantetheine-phosphate adenylyltransferase
MSSTQPTIAVFPGTFDPVTLGHLDVIQRGRRMFDHMIVAVGVNPEKSPLFPLEDRLAILRELTGTFGNVSVESYEGLTVDLVRQRKAVAILRGLRNMSDLDYEFQIALTNRAVADVETAFIMTSQEYSFTSSSLIKQIVSLGHDPGQLKTLLPERVIEKLREYVAMKTGPFGDVGIDPLRG